MKTINTAFLVLIIGALLVLAGCAASASHSSNAVASSALEENRSARERALNDQPLMATGGDLVMRQIVAQVVAA